jgi:hypothetical protein
MCSFAQMWPELEPFLEAMSFQKKVVVSDFQCWLQINYKE